MTSVRSRELVDVGRARVKLQIWQAIALIASGMCVYLLFSVRRSGEDPIAAEAAAAETASGSSVRRTERSSRRVDSAQLAYLLEQLELARATPARCAAMRRLARSHAIDEAATERIASYALARSNPFELRTCAVAALGEVQHDAAIEPLLELSREPQSPIMEAAIRALAQADGESARKAVLTLAKTGPRSVRVMTAIALAEAGAEQALPLLLELLQGGPFYERERLVTALGATRDPRALPVLKELLTSGARGLAHSAITAIGELGGAGATETLLQVMRERPAYVHSVAQALARIGDGPARKALLAAAEGEASNMAMAALQALTSVDGDDVRAVMLRALENRQPGRVQAATEYFATRADAGAVDALARLARAGSPHTMFPAMHALARIGGESARSELIELASAGGRSKEAALSALANMPDGAEDAREIALEHLRDGGVAMGGMLEVLASDDSPEAQAALLTAAERGGPSAMQALMLLGQRTDSASLRALERLATSAAQPEQRGQALFALAQSGDPSVMKTLQAGLKSEHAMVRSQALSAIAQTGGAEAEEALLAASRDPAPDVASNAAGMLAHVGTPRALTRLEEVAQSKDPQVARQALFALSANAPERAATLVEKLASSSDPGARQSALMVVSSLPEAAASRIVAGGLRDSDASVVNDALNGAGAMALDNESVRQALTELTSRAQLPEELRTRAQQLLSGDTSMVGREMEMSMRRHGPGSIY